MARSVETGCASGVCPLPQVITKFSSFIFLHSYHNIQQLLDGCLPRSSSAQVGKFHFFCHRRVLDDDWYLHEQSNTYTKMGILYFITLSFRAMKRLKYEDEFGP